MCGAGGAAGVRGMGMRAMAWRRVWGLGLACVLAVGPARAAQFDITALPGEGALQVTGRIGPRFAASVQAALDAHPDTRVLVVRSRGGLLHEARKVAALLNARRIAIRADGRCASACAVLWAATDAREMTADARLGLHRSKWPVPLPAPLRAFAEKRSDRANVRTFLDAGFSAALARRAAETPSSSMYWIGALELQQERVSFALE
jgi:hypothetical protein